MKIKKTTYDNGIETTLSSQHVQHIFFDSEKERDIVFDHWTKALEELEASKAIFRPVYEDKNGETRILKLRYTTPQEIIEVEKKRFEHFGEGMKLIMIYNELERTFQNVNF